MRAMIEDIKNRLNAKTIHELRQVARAVGVNRPADGKKSRIIEDMLAIAAGEIAPAPRSARGAPPKSVEYDKQLVADIERCRELTLARAEGVEDVCVKSSRSVESEGECEGVLKRRENKWFLHDLNDFSDYGDVFVHTSFVNRFNLKEGDLIAGKVKRSADDELRGLVSVSSVNAMLPDNAQRRNDYDKLTRLYPDRKIRLLENSPACKVINRASPLAAGQRAFVVGNRNSGAEKLLCDVAGGVEEEINVIVILAESRPEDYTALRRANAKARIFSPAGWGSDAVKCAEAALSYAKRMCELSRDCLLIVEDLTLLCKSFDYSLSQVSSSLSTNALMWAKNFLLSSVNAEEGGSITILCGLLPPSGDGVADAVYYGLKNLGNMCLTLSKSLARIYVNPPIDLENSGAENEEKLLSEDRLKKLIAARKMVLKGEAAAAVNYILDN